MRWAAFFGTPRLPIYRVSQVVFQISPVAFIVSKAVSMSVTWSLAYLANDSSLFEGSTETKLARLRSELASLATTWWWPNPPYMAGRT